MPARARGGGGGGGGAVDYALDRERLGWNPQPLILAGGSAQRRSVTAGALAVCTTGMMLNSKVIF